MKATRPYPVILHVLLALGLLVACTLCFDAGKSADRFSLLGEEFEEQLEEILEEEASDGPKSICVFLLPSGNEPLAFDCLWKALDFSTAGCPTVCPSGWIMPLRI